MSWAATRDLRGFPLRWVAGTREQGLSAILAADLIVLGVLLVAVKIDRAWPCLLTIPVFALSIWWLATLDSRGHDLDVHGPYEPHEPRSNVKPRE